jgi:transposase InsO family protein
MSERKRFVETINLGQQCTAAVCRDFGVSRKTGYKWLKRFQEEGEAGLAERSRRPDTSPHRTPPEVEAQIVAARQAHPVWGPRKLKAVYDDGHWPALSTIAAVLRRHGCIHPSASAQHRPMLRFEHPVPNGLWQMDFKGDWCLPDGRRCYPLTVLDDHSRFLLTLHACSDQTTESVQAALEATFRCYGLPERMLMDNGPPWSDGAQSLYTRLKVWLLLLDIPVTHGRPSHPQTQGKDERLHRTLKEELLVYQQADSLRGWQQHFDRWRHQYNTVRPHQALGDVPPCTRYRPSVRRFPETLPVPAYAPPLQVRRVDTHGRISFRHWQLKVGKAFARQRVGVLVDATDDGQLEVYFGRFCIRTFDQSTLQTL